MRTSTALLDLFKDDREWRRFFRSCCERSTHRLTAQTLQFREELKGRGHPYPAEEVEDALLGLARELLPESAAAEWDAEWAHALCKDALSRLAKHYTGLSAEEKDALDLSAQDVWDERMTAAGLDNDPAAFRAALKGWEQPGLEAMKRAQGEGGRGVRYGSRQLMRSGRATVTPYRDHRPCRDRSLPRPLPIILVDWVFLGIYLLNDFGELLVILFGPVIFVFDSCSTSKAFMVIHKKPGDDRKHVLCPQIACDWASSRHSIART